MASEKQSRIFLGVLYPDSESYEFEKVLSRLEDTFLDLAYITHDADTDENGLLKKAHVHWCGKRSSPAPLSTVANALGIAENNIEFCRNWKYSLRYLIHADNPDKFQYSPDKVTANFPFNAVIEGKLEALRSRKIYHYIHEFRPPDIDALADWCFENDCWSECRRNWALWSAIIRNVAEKYDKK